MNEENIVLYKNVVVPVSPVIRPIRDNGFGSVEGLEDDELAEPEELERMVFIEEFGPVLALPAPKRKNVITPDIDEDGKPDWGAFGTVDFDRYRPKRSKESYVIEQLQRELFGQNLMIEIISNRLDAYARYSILKYVFKGIIDIGHISDMDMYLLVERVQRAIYLVKKIATLKAKAKARHRARLRKFLEL